MLTHDIGVAGLKIAPPAIIAGLTLNELVAVATLIYIVLQVAHLVWKWRLEWLAKNPKVEP